VEISAPAPRPLDQPWRTATIVAGGVAAVELVLLLIIGIVLLSKPLSASAKEAAITRATGIAKVSAPSRPEPKSATLSRGKTSVLVLNGNGIAGAAAATASRMRARGYPFGATGNAAQSYGRSVVMYRPGRLPEAKRLAADLGIRLVGPLDGIALRQLHRAQLVVVLGT
jgi:LytR cell envelope-related transcriptional attenuator